MIYIYQFSVFARFWVEEHTFASQSKRTVDSIEAETRRTSVLVLSLVHKLVHIFSFWRCVLRYVFHSPVIEQGFCYVSQLQGYVVEFVHSRVFAAVELFQLLLERCKTFHNNHQLFSNISI